MTKFAMSTTRSKFRSHLAGKHLFRSAMVAACVMGPLACSSDPETADDDGGNPTIGAGSGGVPTSVGGADASANAGGRLEIDVMASGGAEAVGAGGMATTQDGGLLALTPEQVVAIQEAECADLSAEADKLPAALQFVVDVSGSMGYDTPATAPLSKWQVALPALQTALAGIQDEMAVGLQLYPTQDDPTLELGVVAPPPMIGTGGAMMGAGGAVAAAGGAASDLPSDFCADARGRVDIAEMGMVGSAHRVLLETTLDGAPLLLGTPTHDAYVNALEASLKPYPATGNKFMVLMTDGAPTQEIGCGASITEGSSTDPIIASIAAAYAEGIGTFIIGSPGTEGTNGAEPRGGESAQDTRPWLSAAALAGGTGLEGCTVEGPNFCHLDMTQATDFGTALSEGLALVTDKVAATCSFELPVVDGEEIDRERTNVMINWSDGTSDLVLHDAVGDCTEGWLWGTNGEITLCEATCTGIETDPEAIVTVSLGCTPDEIIIK
jgi:hypothetical protein